MKIIPKMVNSHVNFQNLGIREDEIEDLKYMIEKHEEFNENLEIIITKNLIQDIIKEDFRIREKIRENINSFRLDIALGRSISKEELYSEYQDIKICYCTHKNNFNATILIIFHELSHFNDYFDIDYDDKKKWISGTISISKNLQLYVKTILNEFYAEYNVVKLINNLSRYKRFKNDLENLANSFLYNANNLYFDKLVYQNKLSNMELMNLYFEKGFKNLFHFLGLMRGFDDITEDLNLQDSWQEFIQNNNLFSSNFLKSLKSELFKNFNKQKEMIETTILNMLKEYFKRNHNIEFG